ncbi:MAG: hypothetical protein J0L69_15510 [Bacteroidetes bacterium]|nr:hypothetical protein [Bacteroidota bacterium]
MLFVGILWVLISGFVTQGNQNFDSIRTNEIVVQDKYGNDRIIISPEIVSPKTRLRKDTLSGVLILDASGHDRVILGASPYANIKGKLTKRAINGPYGLAFNDKEGLEKGGFGYYDDRGLSALGLDGPSGEGIVLFVPKEELFGQKVGILINDPQKGGQLFYIGTNIKGQNLFNMEAPGKGQFSIQTDSSACIKFYDFKKASEEIMLKTK